MIEAQRILRNVARLGELYSTFEVKVRAMLDDLEGQGYRPRIQVAYRSLEEQLRAYATGKSKLKYGFHNVTGPNGTPQALAVDCLDDDQPLHSPMGFILRLARAAQDQGLVTGIRWGLPMRQVEALNSIIKSRQWDATPKIGWDPLHCEITGISPVQARKGMRPVQGTCTAKQCPTNHINTYYTLCS